MKQAIKTINIVDRPYGRVSVQHGRSTRGLRAVEMITDKFIELDKYYTSEAVVNECLKQVDLTKYDLIIEPSAGAGAFYNKIKHHNKVGLDIYPEGERIIKANWLEYKVSDRYKNVLVLGNPPFGKMNALSSDFIKHAMSFSNVKTIAFILPNVYRKHTRQRIIPNDWRIKNIVDIGKNAFVFNEEIKHVPCSFFVFDKSKGYDLKINPNEYKDKVDFVFGNTRKFDVFMFGAAPQRIITNPKPNNRGHFLISKIPVRELVEKLKNINWQGNSCANGGVYWLTQAEVAEHYYRAYCL